MKRIFVISIIFLVALLHFSNGIDLDHKESGHNHEHVSNHPESHKNEQQGQQHPGSKVHSENHRSKDQQPDHTRENHVHSHGQQNIHDHHAHVHSQQTNNLGQQEHHQHHENQNQNHEHSHEHPSDHTHSHHHHPNDHAHSHVHNPNDHTHGHGHHPNDHTHGHDHHPNDHFHGHDHHPNDHTHGHDHQDHDHAHTHGDNHHDHTHGHPHHHNHHDDDDTKKHEEFNILAQIERNVTKFLRDTKDYFTRYFDNQLSQTVASVFIVSFPSFPTFLFLLFIGKIFSKSKQGGSPISNFWLNVMIAFSCGTLLGDVFLHIIPFLYFQQMKEALQGGDHHHHNHNHDHGHGGDHHDDHVHFTQTSMLIIFGIVTFFTLDFIFAQLSSDDHTHDHKEHSHDHGEKSQASSTSAFTYLIGDFLHNFTDGLALGASYSINVNLGLSSTFVILIHQLPHEIGDFAFLIKKNYKLGSIFKTQIITSLGAMIGGLIGIYFGEIFQTKLLSFTAGGFLYMCLTTILPEITNTFNKKSSLFGFIMQVIFLGLGVASMYFITLLE